MCHIGIKCVLEGQGTVLFQLFATALYNFYRLVSFDVQFSAGLMNCAFCWIWCSIHCFIIWATVSIVTALFKAISYYGLLKVMKFNEGLTYVIKQSVALDKQTVWRNLCWATLIVSFIFIILISPNMGAIVWVNCAKDSSEYMEI